MTKEKITPSTQAVISALTQFTNDQLFTDSLVELPVDMQDIVERLLETEHANELEVRLKALRCLKFLRDFSQAMSPFSHDEIAVATHYTRTSHV